MPEERKISPAILIGAGLAIGTVAAIGIYALAKATPPPGLSELYGVVTDAETGSPLPWVTVSLNGATDLTNTIGEYWFYKGLNPGVVYTITFEKEGYEILTGSVVLVEGGNEQNVSLVPTVS
ncbi:unnamed protein product [marine sediment metagenome]|uniref:Carboxypeptidase regulatory-like domain-containing protein n=1 Tax=marine sediment metagenome TaxID=412755 RepID=X1R196_9ZZZZ